MATRRRWNSSPVTASAGAPSSASGSPRRDPCAIQARMTGNANANAPAASIRVVAASASRQSLRRTASLSIQSSPSIGIALAASSRFAAADAAFEREWARGVIAVALARFEEACRAGGHLVRLEAFRRYDLVDADGPARPTYAGLAAVLGIPATQVTNHLHWARREFRRHVLDTLRDITADDAEFRAEARALLGTAPP